MLLPLYVDDIIITDNLGELITEIIYELAKEFAMKDLGQLHFILGV